MDQSQILNWMWGDARHLPLNQFFNLYCTKLSEAGLPVRRIHLSMQELHPEYLATSFLLMVTGTNERHFYRSDHPEESVDYLNSPLKPLFEGGSAIRGRLDGANSEFDFPVMNELREEGYTDYAIYPLSFRYGRYAAISFAADRVGGFSDDHIAFIESLLLPTQLQFEFLSLDRMFHTVLNTYVGNSASKRIVTGEIERGVAKPINAVLWYADLRRFTELAETLAPDELMQLLNEYFEILVHAVEDGGGEVLKFIGDALLAVFPLSERHHIADVACEVALAAAEEAIDTIANANKNRGNAKQPKIELGIALHVGEVMFGNIGSENRLDFTVIGPAVNLAARLQELAPQLNVPLIVSDTFKAHSRRDFDDLGDHALKGIQGPQRVFTLSSTRPLTSAGKPT
jgi:adenylate cyclase